MSTKPPGDLQERLKRHKLPIFIGIFVMLFITGIFAFFVATKEIPDTSHQDSSSYSYLGHRAFFQLLRENGYHVLVSRWQLPVNSDLPPVIYLAPNPQQAKAFLQQDLDRNIAKLLRGGATICYVCRKWNASTDFRSPGWIKHRKLKNPEVVTNEVNRLFLDRFKELNVKHADKYLTASFNDGSRWQLSAAPLQIFDFPERASRKFKVLVETEKGPLVIATREGRGRLILVSEPDIFTNSGLAKADNGLVAFSLLNRIADNKKIIVDEVAHGFGADPGLLETMFSFPCIVITIQLILLGGFAALMVGRPFLTYCLEPMRQRSREEQVNSVAALMYAGRHHPMFLRQYFQYVLKELQHYYPALRRMSLKEQLVYLDTIAREKKIRENIQKLHQNLQIANSAHKVYHVFSKIYRWKERMIHGQYS